MSDGVNTLDTAAIRQQAEQALRAQPVRRILAVDGCPVQVIADPVYVMLDADHALALLDVLAHAEGRAAALEAALTETMARYLAARDLIAQYDAIWSQPVDRDWDEQTEAGRAAYRALAPDAIARALGDAPATREE